MRICRFNNNRLGLVRGDLVVDVTPALDLLPSYRWPLPYGDPLITNLDMVGRRAQEIATHQPKAVVVEAAYTHFVIRGLRRDFAWMACRRNQVSCAHGVATAAQR